MLDKSLMWPLWCLVRFVGPNPIGVVKWKVLNKDNYNKIWTNKTLMSLFNAKSVTMGAFFKIWETLILAEVVHEVNHILHETKLMQTCNIRCNLEDKENVSMHYFAFFIWIMIIMLMTFDCQASQIEGFGNTRYFAQI